MDTGWKFPTTFGNPSNLRTNPSNLGADDGSNAAEGTVGDKEDTATFAFGIPVGATINGIEIEIQGNAAGGNNLDTVTIQVNLSWNAGTNYTAAKEYDFTKTTPVTTETAILGGAADTWGRAWTDGEFSDANFRARL